MSARTEAVTAPKVTRRGRRLPAIVVVVALALAGYTTWTNLSPVTLTTSVEIPASAERVWKVLTDLRSYPTWNPFIVSSEVTTPGGELATGAVLRNVMRDASGDTTFTPTVLTADPGRELRWIGKIGPGWIVDGEHVFELHALGPDRVRLVQHESFTGVAVPLFAGTLRENTLPQFEAMNRALVARVLSLP